MNKTDKIFIAGHNGLLGREFIRKLESLGFNNLITIPSQNLDLRRQDKVESFFNKNKPDVVIICAAKVGGIQANINFPHEFIYDNLMIQSNIMQSSLENNIKKLVFFGASCIYPKTSEQPMSEDALFKGEPEITNDAFAYAKIAGIKLLKSINSQHGKKYITVIPSNIYGPYDNFDLNKSHVLSALIRKFAEAKKDNKPFVELWGTGAPLREFIYVEDVVDGVLHLLKSDISQEIINIGTGIEISIYNLAVLIKEKMGYQGELIFDKSKPDGNMRKVLDSSLIKKLGWESKTNFEKGISNTIEWYLTNKL